MILLLTNSIDGTADILVDLSSERGQPVFRFNIDLWQDYKFAWTPSGFAISDPIERIINSESITACLWRRPSLQETPEWRGGTPDDRAATEAELHTVVREIAEWAKSLKLLRLIDPAAQRRAGRLAQMRVAREFFSVPEWLVGWGFQLPAGKRMVKRLAQQVLGPNRDRFIYVQSTETSQLSPEFPWFTQEIGAGDRDATVLYVNGKCFGFEMRLKRHEYAIEDWRTLNNSAREHWRPWYISAEAQKRIHDFMERLGLYYGRLDFLTNGDALTFLEVNPNGQFGWLDDPTDWQLHRAVLDAVLDPKSAITGFELVREQA